MAVLHALVFGKGEPLLILHGYFGMGDNWKTLGKKFAENYEVHLIDQRNHGRSFHADDFSYELMVGDLKEYITHHNLKRVNIIGHSMGGKTAMFFAAVYPEMVRKLIVADIGPKYYAPHHDSILSALNTVDFAQINSRNDIDAVLSKWIPEFGVRQFLLKNVYRMEKDKFAYRFNLESLTKNNPKIGQALPESAIYNGATLFLKGGNSNYIKKEDKSLIIKHFPNSHVIEIENAGHWLHAENPTQFYKAVVDFLKNN